MTQAPHILMMVKRCKSPCLVRLCVFSLFCAVSIGFSAAGLAAGVQFFMPSEEYKVYESSPEPKEEIPSEPASKVSTITEESPVTTTTTEHPVETEHSSPSSSEYKPSSYNEHPSSYTEHDEHPSVDHKQLNEMRSGSVDRAKQHLGYGTLNSSDEDENDEEAVRDIDFGGVSSSLKNISNFLKKKKDNDVGTTRTRPPKKPKKPVKPIGPQDPAIITGGDPVAPGLAPPRDPPKKVDPKKNVVANDDGPVDAGFRKRVRGNVMDNDEFEGYASVTLTSRPQHGRVRLFSSGNWSYKNSIMFKKGGTDSFSYELKGESEDEVDTATVTIDIAAKKKKKKKKKKGDPDPDDRGGGRGGPGGPASNFAANCRATAEKYSKLPPDEIAAKFGSDEAVQSKYSQAGVELIPGDRSHEFTQRAKMQVETLLANGGDELELDLAQAEYQKSVAIQRNVVEATVQPPIKTFEKLVRASRTSQGAIPVHPLLESKDGVTAAFLYKKMQQPAIQKEITQFASRLKTLKADAPLTRKLQSEAVAIYKRVTSEYDFQPAQKSIVKNVLPRRISATKPAVEYVQELENVRLNALKTMKNQAGKGDLEKAISLVSKRVELEGNKLNLKPEKVLIPAIDRLLVGQDEQQRATRFVRKLAGAMPLLKQLRRGVISANKKGSKQYVEHAAAQTFFSEMVGKERLLAMREIMQGEVGQVVGVSRDGLREVKEIAMDEQLQVRLLEEIQPLNKKRLAYHAKQLTQVRTRQADAALRLISAPYKTRGDGIEQRYRGAKQRLDRVMAKMPATVRQATQNLPKMKQKLAQARKEVVRRLDKGEALNNKDVELKLLTKEVSVSEKALKDAHKNQSFTNALSQFNSANKSYQADLRRLKNDTAYAKTKKKVQAESGKKLKADLTRQLARKGAFSNPAETVLRRSDGAIPVAAIDDFKAFSKQLPALLPPLKGSFTASVDASNRAAATAEVSQSPNFWTAADLSTADGRQRLATQSSRQVTNKTLQAAESRRVVYQTEDGKSQFSRRQLDNTGSLKGMLHKQIQGTDSAQRFNTPKQMGDIARIQRGDTSALQTTPKKPAGNSFVDAFNHTVGALGWAHEFESDDALQQFAQERIGGLGMVHKKSDLEDPEYKARLLKERLGGLVAIHRFDSMEDMRDFVNSRLGGMGRAYTCLDLLDNGWSEDQVNNIFDRAKEFGAKEFETKKDWGDRMLEEHEDEFTQDGNGKVRFKTPKEKRQEREAEMLASGHFIRDPQTGNLVNKDTKAGRQVKQKILDQKPKKVRITLAGGREATLTIDGFTSLNDALADAMRAKNYTQNAAGDWIDGNGNVVITGGAAKHFDELYTGAMEDQFTGFSNVVTRRPPPPPPTPPTTKESLQGLTDDVVNSVGFNVRGVEIGGRKIDVEVLPGESFSDALTRTLAGSKRFKFDVNGDLYDTDTGEIVMGHENIAKKDEKYRGKVLESIFGKGQKGLSEEVLWMSQFGTPAQKRQAQLIITQLERQAESIRNSVKAQNEIQKAMAELEIDTELTDNEKRRQRQILKVRLEQANQSRRDNETALFNQGIEANESAKRAQEKAFTREERRALALYDDVQSLQKDILELDKELKKNPRSTRKRQLEAAKAKKLQQLYGLNQSLIKQSGELEQPARLAGRIPDRSTLEKTFSSNTAADWQDARDRAKAVRFEERDGKMVAVYIGADGEPFVDPGELGADGKPKVIVVSELAGKKLLESKTRQQGKEADYYNRNYQSLVDAQDAESSTRKEIEALQSKGKKSGLKGWEQTKLKRLQAKAASQKQTADEIKDRIEERTTNYRQLYQLAQAEKAKNSGNKKGSSPFGDLLDAADKKATSIGTARVQAKKDWDEGVRTIIYEDENGVEREWVSEAGREHIKTQKAVREAELAVEEAIAEADAALNAIAKELEDEVNRAVNEEYQKLVASGAIPKGTSRIVEQSGDDEDGSKIAYEILAYKKRQIALAKRAKLIKDEQAKRFRGQFDRYEDELQNAERLQAKAKAELTAAKKEIDKARSGKTPNTADLKKRYADAERALAEANQAVDQKRQIANQAEALAASNNPALIALLNEQQKKIKPLYETYTSAQVDAAAKLRALHKLKADPKATAIEIKRAREAYVLASKTESESRQQVIDQQTAMAVMVDNALYVNSTPEFNKSRLAQLKARAGDKGTQKGLTKEENEEYWRRKYLQEYHDKVGEARLKAEMIKAAQLAFDENSGLSREDRKKYYTVNDAMADLMKQRGYTLSSEGKWLDKQGTVVMSEGISLSKEQMVVLVGERQRQQKVSELVGYKDQTLAAQEMKLVGDWMTSLRGGRGGKSLLHPDQDGTLRDEMLGFLDNRTVANKQLGDAQSLVTSRQKELADARAASLNDPSAYTRRQVDYARELLALAENRVGFAQDDLRRANAAAKERDNALMGNALLQHRKDQFSGSSALVAERTAKMQIAMTDYQLNPSAENRLAFERRQADLDRAKKMLSESEKGLRALTGAESQPGGALPAVSYMDILRSDRKVEEAVKLTKRQAEEKKYAAAHEREYEGLLQVEKLRQAQEMEPNEVATLLDGSRKREVTLQADRAKALAAGDSTLVQTLDRQISNQQRVSTALDDTRRQKVADRRMSSERLKLAQLKVAKDKAETAGNSDQVKALKNQIADQQVVATYHENYAARVRNQMAPTSFLEAQDKLLPKEWELSAEYKAREQEHRFQKALDIQRRMSSQDQQRAASEGQMRKDIGVLEDELLALQLSNKGDSNKSSIATTEQALSDARAAYNYRSDLFNNGDRNLREEWETLVIQNRNDGLGPTSSHDVHTIANQHNINLNALFLADATTIDRQRRGGSEIIELYQDERMTAEKPAWGDYLAAEFNPLDADSTLRKSANLPWLGKTLAGNVVGLGKGAYNMVEGVVKLVPAVADATYESVGILAGADIETDTLDSINKVVDVVNKRGVGSIVSDMKNEFFKKMNKGDAHWNASVAGGMVAFEVGAALLTGGESVLVRGASGLSTTSRALARTARVLDKVSDITRPGGQIANTAKRWSRASEFVADGMRGLAGRSLALDSGLRGAARKSVGALVDVIEAPVGALTRKVPDALKPDILPSLQRGLAKASVEEIQNAQRMASSLGRAEGLLARAARSNKTGEIANLVDEAMGIKKTAASFFEKNPKAFDLLAESGGLTERVAALNRSRAASAFGKAADKAESVGEVATSGAFKKAAIAASFAEDLGTASQRQLQRAVQNGVDKRVLGALDEFAPAVGVDPNIIAGNLRRALQGDGVSDRGLRAKANDMAQKAVQDQSLLQREVARLERSLQGAGREAKEAGTRAIAGKKEQMAKLKQLEKVMNNLRDAPEPSAGAVARIPPDTPVKPASFDTPATRARDAPGATTTVAKSSSADPAATGARLANDLVNLDPPARLPGSAADDALSAAERQANELAGRAGSSRTRAPPEGAEKLPGKSTADEPHTLVFTTTKGDEVQLPIGDHLGKGSFSRVSKAGHDADNLVVRMTDIDTHPEAQKLDEFGRKVVEEVMDQDVVRIVRREAYFEVANSADPILRTRRAVEVVERAPPDAKKLFKRNHDGLMSPGQAKAFDRATKEFNDKGFVWGDNKHDNYSFEKLAGEDEWRVVVVDPGGILPIKSSPGRTAAQNARAIQRHINAPDAEKMAELAKVARKYHGDFIKEDLLNEFGTLIDFKAVGLKSLDEVRFNPGGVAGYPKARELFGLPDDEIAKRVTKWKVDRDAAGLVPAKPAEVTRSVQRASDNLASAQLAAKNPPGGEVDPQDLAVAHKRMDDLQGKLRDEATPEQIAKARKTYDDLNSRALDAKARKDLADDLEMRESILKKVATDDDALQGLTRSDLDWLSGKRNDLTPEEIVWARNMVDDVGGDWTKITKQIGGDDLSDLEMHKIVSYRKKVVDEMLDEAIARVEQETGRKLSRQAFGSTNLSSDYDLSVTGWGAERVVGEFNQAFRNRFGKEPGSFFDTNVYTDPVYNLFSRKSLNSKGLDLPPAQLDEYRQFMFDQMSNRKYLNDDQWAQHVKILESSATDDATRRMIRETLERVDSAERTANQRLQQRVAEIARRTNQNAKDKNVLFQAKNELYEESLGSIDAFRQDHDFLSRLNAKRPDIEAPEGGVKGQFLKKDGTPMETAYSRAVEKMRTLYRSGDPEDIAKADVIKEQWLGRMENQMRNRQGTALYYASEAYQTQGTIAHVVREIQAGRKDISFDSLTKRLSKAPDADATGGYLNSFNENRANMFKELNELRSGDGFGTYGGKAAGKAGKYLIRQLDAAHEAGVDLSRMLPDRLIKGTIAANTHRGSKAALKEALKNLGYADPVDFVRQAESASHILLREGMKRSPLRSLVPDMEAHQREVNALMRSVGAVDPGNVRSVAKRYSSEAIPDEVPGLVTGTKSAVDLDSRGAESLAKGLRTHADDLAGSDGSAERVATIRSLAKEADARAAKLRDADFQRTLERPQNDGMRERIVAGPVDDRALQRQLALAQQGGVDEAVIKQLNRDIQSSAVRRAEVAQLLNETPDWELMSKRLPGDDPQLAAQLSDFREWAFDKVQQRWPNTVRTGTSGKMGNDLDFSVSGPNGGRDQLAIEKFLREDIEIAPGINGLGKNWDRKLHSTAFGDPELIHIYDRLVDPVSRTKVRESLAGMVEAAQFDRLKHSMSPENWANFKRSMPDIDIEAQIARHPVPKSFDRSKLMLERDKAYQRLIKSGHQDVDAAQEVSRIQVLLNRNDPEAYLSFGGVKQTVTFKEGLVKFDQSLMARMENGRVVVRPDPEATSPGLVLQLPGQRTAPRTFTNVADVRKYLKQLKQTQPGVQRLADQLVVQRTLNELEQTLLRVDASERYQSVLGNMAFFEHQIELVGGDPLLALRRYQTSKYLDRILGEAFEMGIPAHATSFLGEAKSLARRFYKERDPTIARFFGTEASNMDAAAYAKMQRQAATLLDELRQLNNNIAVKARANAVKVMRYGQGPGLIPEKENPAQIVTLLLGQKGRPVADAYRTVRRSLDDKVGGIAADLSKREAGHLVVPSQINTLDDAVEYLGLPANLGTEARRGLSANQQRLYGLRHNSNSTPTALRVVTTETDSGRLKVLQKQLFKDHRVVVEFTQPDGKPLLPVAVKSTSKTDPAAGAAQFGENLATVPTWKSPVPKVAAKHGRPTLPKSNQLKREAAQRSEAEIRKSAVAELERVAKQINDAGGGSLETARQFRQALKLQDVQKELDSLLNAARSNGVSEAEISVAMGSAAAYKIAPITARQSAIRGLEEHLLQRAGRLVSDEQINQLRPILNRVANGVSSKADDVQLHSWITRFARSDYNFIQEISRRGRISFESGFEPIVSEQTAVRVLAHAEAKHLISSTETPMLWHNPTRLAKPSKGTGTPPQFYNDTCGLMTVEGVLRDRGLLTKLRPESGLRDIALKSNLFKSGKGMTKGELTEWINREGGDINWAGRKPTAEELMQQLDNDKDLIVMIQTGGDAYHWVRVESFRQSPVDGQLWVAVGDPASGKSWSTPANLLASQIHGDNVLSIDWTRAQAAMQKGLKRSKGRVRKNS